VLSSSLYSVYNMLINHLTDAKKNVEYAKLISSIDLMLEKFNTYWPLCEDIAGLCMILDPRQKADFFISTSKSKKSVKLLGEIYKKYSSLSDSNADPQVNSRKIIEPAPTSLLMRNLAIQACEENVVDELKTYLKEPRIGLKNNKNILHWWRDSSNKFPILSKIACDYLSIFPSSVSSERAFSTSGQTITKERCNLHTERTRELMCLKSWLQFDFDKYKIREGKNISASVS